MTARWDERLAPAGPMCRVAEMDAKTEFKVVMVVSHADASVGGMQKQALCLAQELWARGLSIAVLSKRPKRHDTGRGRNWEEGEGKPPGGIRRVLLPVLDSKPSWSFLFAFLLWATIHRSAFQLIHAHNASLGVSACLVGWFVNRRVVIKMPGMAYVEYLRGKSLRSRIRRWVLLRKAHRFIAVSSEMAEALRTAGIPSGRIALIPNGIELTTGQANGEGPERTALKRDLFGTGEVQVVLFTGRLVKEKGLSRLLKTWASLPDRQGRLLVIAGDGPLRESLESQASTLQLSSTVQFVGHQTAIAQYYRVADLFVLPSETEGISNSLLEAMASGLPVMASDIGGNRDVIEHGVSGVLTDWDKTSEAALILSRLLSDAELRRRMGLSAARRAETFAIGDVAERYIELYRGVLAAS